MALFDWRDSHDAMLDLLERERAILLRGDFDALHRLAPEKERLLTAISSASLRQPDLSKLKDKTDRNQTLLQAAMRGIRSVSRKVAAAQEAGAELKTYDRRGGMQSHDGTAHTLQKRA